MLPRQEACLLNADLPVPGLHIRDDSVITALEYLHAFLQVSIHEDTSPSADVLQMNPPPILQEFHADNLAVHEWILGCTKWEPRLEPRDMPQAPRNVAASLPAVPRNAGALAPCVCHVVLVKLGVVPVLRVTLGRCVISWRCVILSHVTGRVIPGSQEICLNADMLLVSILMCLEPSPVELDRIVPDLSRAAWNQIAAQRLLLSLQPFL